eukprot:3684694-Pyramimonas_sp.AAC.1
MLVQSLSALLRASRQTITNWRSLWKNQQHAAKEFLPMKLWMQDKWELEHWIEPSFVQELADADNGFSSSRRLARPVALALDALREAQMLQVVAGGPVVPIQRTISRWLEVELFQENLGDTIFKRME